MNGRRSTTLNLHIKLIYNENFTHPLHYMKMRGPESFNLRRFVLFFPCADDPEEGVVGARRPVHVGELLDGLQLHLQLQWQEDPLCGVAIL